MARTSSSASGHLPGFRGRLRFRGFAGSSGRLGFRGILLRLLLGTGFRGIQLQNDLILSGQELFGVLAVAPVDQRQMDGTFRLQFSQYLGLFRGYQQGDGIGQFLILLLIRGRSDRKSVV